MSAHAAPTIARLSSQSPRLRLLPRSLEGLSMTDWLPGENKYIRYRFTFAEDLGEGPGVWPPYLMIPLIYWALFVGGQYGGHLKYRQHERVERDRAHLAEYGMFWRTDLQLRVSYRWWSPHVKALISRYQQRRIRGADKKYVWGEEEYLGTGYEDVPEAGMPVGLRDFHRRTLHILVHG